MEIDKWDFRFLSLAEHIAQWSKDPSTKTGAVITEGIRIVSVGYNGLPQGIQDTEIRYNNRDLKYKMIVHCERNAMLFAKRGLLGCTLYTWPFLSCAQCAGMVIQAGITRVVAPFSDNERWRDDIAISQTMFEEAHVEVLLVR